MTVQREMIQLHTNVYTEPLLQVFCGKIPKDIYEDELIPHFEKCGKIWDLRLMMDPMTGLNRSESAVTMLTSSLILNVFRGYAFITFTTRDEALEAVKQVKLISNLWRNQLEQIPFPFGNNQVGKLLLLNVSKVSEIFSLIPWR